MIRLIVATIGILYPIIVYAQSEGPVNWAEQALTILFALVATLYAVHTRQYKHDMSTLKEEIKELRLDYRSAKSELHSLALSFVGFRADLAEKYVKKEDLE